MYSVMKVGIYFNKKYLPGYLETVQRIKERLGASGIECAAVCSPEDLDGTDVLMVLGGDGTILTVAADCARRGIKIMGINYGHIGFLAEFEQEKLDKAMELLCSGDYSTEKRSMISVEIGGRSFIALTSSWARPPARRPIRWRQAALCLRLIWTHSYSRRCARIHSIPAR